MSPITHEGASPGAQRGRLRDSHVREAREDVVEEASSHSPSIVQLCSTIAVTFFSYSRLGIYRSIDRESSNNDLSEYNII